MQIKNQVTITLTTDEVREIVKKHFSDKYQIDAIYFDTTSNEYGRDEVDKIRLVGSNIEPKKEWYGDMLPPTSASH